MIPEIITPMAFSLVRDSICELLATERDNQERIALEKGYSQEQVFQELDFVIFPKRFRIPNVKDMPCVFVYFDRMEFPEDGQFPNENYAHGNLQVDYYCMGESTTLTDSETGDTMTIPADSMAEDRLNYLSAQLYKILCSEENFCKGTKKIVSHVRLKSWQRIITPEELNQAATVLGGSFSFEIGFNEPAYYNNAKVIKEFYTTLKIRDEFIDPFIRVVLNNNEK